MRWTWTGERVLLLGFHFALSFVFVLCFLSTFDWATVKSFVSARTNIAVVFIVQFCLAPGKQSLRFPRVWWRPLLRSVAGG